MLDMQSGTPKASRAGHGQQGSATAGTIAGREPGRRRQAQDGTKQATHGGRNPQAP